MIPPETLGLRLTRARLRLAAERGAEVSGPALGKELGLSGEAIRKYEADQREPDLGMIVRLAAVLRVTPGWLAFGEAANVVPLLGGDENGGEGGQPSVPRPRPDPDSPVPPGYSKDNPYKLPRPQTPQRKIK